MNALTPQPLNPAYPPFRMKSHAAAYYCGMSVTALLREVSEGNIDSGVKTAGGRYWLRSALEDYMLGRPTAKHDFGKGI